MLGIKQIVSRWLRSIRASGTARPAKWLADWASGSQSDSGTPVGTKEALSYAPVMQAISVLAGDVGQLPLDLYRRIDERNKERDRRHPAFRVARRRANPYMSAATFRETMMLYCLLHGNGVAEIERDGSNRPKHLWPLLPHLTTRSIDRAGQLWYVTRAKPGGEERFLRPEHVIHISNFGPDGTWGYSTITLARNSWGLGLAGEKYASKYFANNAMPSGTIDHPAVLEEEGYNRLRRNWKAMHEGLDNTARVAILEEGAKYSPIAFSQKDSQWLESREFQREEVASWFNLPPHKLGVLKDSNYSNMVEAERHYLSTGLMRWQVKWQDEYDEKLLTVAEKRSDSHFYEFNNDALLRGDIKSRYEAYSTALGGHPFMEVNEIRGRENLNEVEGGNVVPKPLNMSPGQDATEEAAADDGDDADDADDQVTAKLNELLVCEANRVCHAAKSAKNFVGWLDAFYDRWPRTIDEAVTDAWDKNKPMALESISLTITCWADAHKAQCLESAGEATTGDDLAARLTALTVTWPEEAADYHKGMRI